MASSHDFAAQVHQTGIVSDVSVRQKDAFDIRTLFLGWGELIEFVKLVTKVGSAVEQVRLSTWEEKLR